jgi:hypothetical protein
MTRLPSLRPLQAVHARELKRGAHADAIKQAGLTQDEFLALL